MSADHDPKPPQGHPPSPANEQRATGSEEGAPHLPQSADVGVRDRVRGWPTFAIPWQMWGTKTLAAAMLPRQEKPLSESA